MSSTFYPFSVIMPSTIQFALQTVQEPSQALVNAMTLLSVATLIFGIPSIFATTPTLPVPLAIRRRTSLPVSKITLFIAAYLLSYLYDSASRVMCDVLLVLAFLSTFTIPGKPTRTSWSPSLTDSFCSTPPYCPTQLPTSVINRHASNPCGAESPLVEPQ